MREISVVAAVDREWGIGKNGVVPWDCPADMTFFRLLTRGDYPRTPMNAVIMGRKTFESIPQSYRPLRCRLNIVLSRGAPFPIRAGVSSFERGSLRVASSFDKALWEAQGVEGQTFVIGGASVYRDALYHPSLESLYLTRVDVSADCDVKFPSLPGNLRFRGVIESGKSNGLRYSVQLWKPETAARSTQVQCA